MSLVFDSNVFIYHLNGVLGDYGQSLIKRGILENGVYSVISKIEVLGFSQPETAAARANRLFDALRQIDLTAEIVDRTIALRQARKIKIPDAIIAATALSQQLPLVTHNIRDFERIEGLELIDPLQEA
jgi:predicted nucleic acid-binding protein